MKKKPVDISVTELLEILERFFGAAHELNYAVKIVGHPGVGKSAVVKEAARRRGFLFIDTRLAFKENVDLGGYPVPLPDERRMVYYRPKFIPPETVPDGSNGVVWFLDEANRAHPTVIQTLFQIITERTCGEHRLADRTAIVLAGNLGDSDSTTVTEFDDAALDGRLAVFHLKPTPADWLRWAGDAGVHPSVMRYIAQFPERLWDEKNIDPNPRGWHQASQAVALAYGLTGEEELARHLADNPDGTLEKTLYSLVGGAAGIDFIAQVTAPRALTTAQILAGDDDRLAALREGSIPAEDFLWAAAGALMLFRDRNLRGAGTLPPGDMAELCNLLRFIGFSRADLRLSFFYQLVRECGIFSRIPEALRHCGDDETRRELVQRFGELLED